MLVLGIVGGVSTLQKHLGYFNHILGCLSCISVTKECYQIGYLEGSLRSFFISYISSSLFRRPIWQHSWHFYQNHATKGLLQGQMCMIIKTTNLTRNADL